MKTTVQVIRPAKLKEVDLKAITAACKPGRKAISKMFIHIDGDHVHKKIIFLN